jgi:hypothetical protein
MHGDGAPAAPDPFDRLEKGVKRIAPWVERSKWETGNRIGLLWVHAIVGLFSGPQMALWGSATIIESAVGIWTRPILASLAFGGGMFLALGLTHKPRSIPLEVIGLTLIGTWDLFMTAGLVFARWHQHDWSIIPLDETLPEGYASAYPQMVYAGLFALIVVHLATLRSLKKNRKLEQITHEAMLLNQARQSEKES